MKLLPLFLAGMACLPLTAEATRERQADRTYIFCRAQWKYGLERDDYLNRWVDRPLFVDPSLRESSDQPAVVQYPAFARTQEIVRDYRLDGMALYPETAGRAIIYDHASRYGAESFKLLTELVAKPNERIVKRNDVIEKALATAVSFRVKGRLVLIVGIADTQPIEYWQKVASELREQFGEKVAFLPGVIRPLGKPLHEWRPKYLAGEVTEAEKNAILEYYRQWARVGDGLYFSSPSSIVDERRRFDADFYRDFVIAPIRTVLSEPEFAGKLFGLSAYIGHENCTRFGYTRSSDGTKTLRHSLETALAAEPDLINIPEWDEQNENTSLRPTVYNGTSSLRIMRHYMTVLRGEPQQPLASDDPAIPNLVLSYRKQLVLGEALELELLQIPDGTERGDLIARISLATPGGEVIYESNDLMLAADRLGDVTLTIPSEQLVGQIVVRPQLKIRRNNEEFIYAEGLQPITLRSTWNWDYKWVKQPLRDLLRPVAAQFSVSESDAEGLRRVSASIDAGEPLASLEVINDGKVVAMADPAPFRREGEEVISIRWQSAVFGKQRKVVEGSVSLEGASGRWQIASETPRLAPRLSGNRLDQFKPGFFAQRALLAIPRDELAKARLVLEFPGLGRRELPLPELLAQESYGVPGLKRFNLVLSRFLQQETIPLHLKQSAAKLEVTVAQELPRSVYQMQAIALSGRVYRSEPIVVGVAPDQQVTVYSEATKRPISVMAPAVPSIRYQFTPQHGSILKTDAGRPFHGILGGFASLATDQGGGESNDGSPFLAKQVEGSDTWGEAPVWEKDESERDILRFNGKSHSVVFPQGVIPRRAGFTITMEIRPEATHRRQMLIANRGHYPGSLSIYLQNGTLRANFLDERGQGTEGVDSRMAVKAGEWSAITIRYDQSTLSIAVNGKESDPIAIPGPGIYDTVSIFGGFLGDWFKGDLRSFQVNHHLSTLP